MSEQMIHIIGYDELVLMFGLLGIDGTVVHEKGDFLKVFNQLVNNPSISLIIIALDLPVDLINYLIDFKLNRRKPFVFYLPDIFNLTDDNLDVLLSKIIESIGKMLF